MIRDLIFHARKTCIYRSALARGQAIQMDHELGREIMQSALLKLRAAWFAMLAAMLGER